MEVSKIRQEDHELLQPGMRVRIMPKLMGEELYGADDPEGLAQYCGQEVTVKEVKHYEHYMVAIEEEQGVEFYMEEIECIVEDTELPESDESLSALLGGVM